MDALKQVKILALEQATVVPYLTYRLAMDGMEVIRLEHPVYGDPNRMIGENVLGEERMNSYYLCINAGKKALSLNLADDQGKELFYKLVKELDIDIFVTNQLPKNYEKLGISYDALKAAKPDIIWMGITGFGPDSNEGAYDPILQARSGLMELTGEAGETPQVVGIPLPDMGTSEHGYGLLMKALFQRAVTGEGARIDLSMFESSCSWLTVPITMTANFGKTISRRGNTHEFFCPVSVYETKDGYIYLAVGNDRQWNTMVSKDMFSSLNKPEYEKNAGRIADVGALNQAIAAITRQYDSEELIAFFKSITLPVSRINTIKEVIADPLVEQRLITTQDPRTDTHVTLAPPPNLTPFLDRNQRRMSFPPRFGEQNQEIYGGILGYTVEQLSEMKEKGVI
ncbi:MAG: CoA transferase [Desulfobacteraceae bacterium]|nr:CoA transferase [Desulfobacteraceae bacterium]